MSAPVTKKAIRALLNPAYVRLTTSHTGRVEMVVGRFCVVVQRCYQPPGRVGPAWNVNYRAYDPDLGGMLVMSVDTMASAIDSLHRLLARGVSQAWAETCRAAIARRDAQAKATGQ